VTTGQAPDSLVLLHGFASTFEHNWQQSGWVDILADFGCSAPPIDLPGHGTSTREVDPGAYATVVEDVFSLLPSPANAVGFSAGAELLLRMAIAHAGSFERLALLGLGDNVFDTADPSTLADSLERDAEPEAENVQARLFHRMAASSGNDPRSLAAFLRRPRIPIREDELTTVTCPVLVVLGERDFTKTADRLVAALPSATFVSVPGVDHFATPSDFGVIDATMRFFGFD
jgi:pimeloyl-ACP methyl ester carboxylesterase